MTLNAASSDEILTFVEQTTIKAMSLRIPPGASDEYGLLTGYSGIPLLGFYVSKLCENRSIRSDALAWLDHAALTINAHETVTASYGDGSSGFAWLNLHLLKHQFIVSNLISTRLNSIFESEFEKMLRVQNFDLINGANGLMLYFLMKKSIPRTDELVETYLDALLSASQVDEWHIKWFKKAKKSNTIAIENNLGMPHGMLGTLALLLKIREITTKHTKMVVLLTHSIIRSLCNESILSGLYRFPSITYRDSPRIVPSTLGWCYGDLITGYILLKASEAMNDISLKQYSINLLKETIKRTDCISPNDLTLCHGLISISYLYHKIYKLTHDIEFKDTSLLWAEKSFNELKKASTTAGNYIFSNSALLYGFPGVLLAHLAVQFNADSPWDECMLL